MNARVAVVVAAVVGGLAGCTSAPPRQPLADPPVKSDPAVTPPTTATPSGSATPPTPLPK